MPMWLRNSVFFGQLINAFEIADSDIASGKAIGPSLRMAWARSSR